MQSSTFQSLEDEVRDQIRHRRLDPVTDDLALRQLVREVVTGFDDRALEGGIRPLQDPEEARRLLLESVAGLGPLQQYLDDPHVEEIWINEPDVIG
ncbi:hypothetical protein [Ornithinimicrobium cryptoxanthini]|uniref:Pilus assembly protein CpaF n=1 Tax=Ornithinimicrobium cryptoxanthini TaxID=2934161 RepID=A0ABY4YFH5_9MICO|nr:hypothetical protein [Ornithinimicrobium cryptoxanthini]USQ75364.1 hypothetical protein NF557_12120 [Ornithinimicrobium cryptoxanthini]